MLLRYPTSRWLLFPCAVFLAATLAACGGADARKHEHMERGQAYLAQGNYEKARVEFRNALQIDPNSAEARFQSGIVAEKLNNPREAAGMYQAAVDSDPNHVLAVASLARMYVFAGGTEQALKLVEPMLAKQDHPELLAVRGAARVQQGDLDAALRDARRAVELAPDNENAIALLASVLRQTGDGHGAAAVLRNAIERKPDSGDLRAVLAQLYLQADEREAAETQLKEIVRLKPGEKAPRYQLALFYLGSKQLDGAEAVLREAVAAFPDDTEPKIALAEFLAAHRTREMAERQFQGFIDAAPKDFELRLALGSFLERSGQLPRAEAAYRVVIEKDGTGAAGLSARNRVAALKVQANELEQAEKLIAEVLEENPRDNDALILRGNIALARNQPAAAVADLRAVLRDQPTALGVLRALARAHQQNGEPALAMERLRTAVEAHPKDIEARIDLATLMAQQGELAQATRLLEQVVLESPNSVQARDALFRAQVSAQNWDAAGRSAEDIKLLRPDQPLGFYFAGLVQQAKENPKAAVVEFEKALALQPDSAEPLAALVRAHLSLRQPEVAIERLRQVVTRFPKNAIARNLLGEVLVSQGEGRAGREVFEEAITAAPEWWLPYRGVAMSYLAEKNPDAAIAAYRRGIEHAQEPLALIVDLAALHEQAGRPQEAIAEYEKVVQRDPRSAQAANNLAMLLVSYRKDQASLDRARDLVARFQGSSDSALINTEGWVKYKRGEIAAALPLLEQAVAKAPNSPVMRYHLGMAQYHSGQLERARENLEQSLKAPTRFAGSDEARATLDALRNQG